MGYSRRRCAVALATTTIMMATGSVNAYAPMPMQQQQGMPTLTSAFASTSKNSRMMMLNAHQKKSSSELGMADVRQEDAALTQELQQERMDVTERLNSIATINAAVVGFIGFAVLYELLHVDAEAIIALWNYGLGEHGPDISRAAITLDVLARLPLDALHTYEELVPTNPVFYKACTSGVAYALGDFVSQVYQGRTLSTIDLPRSARSGAAGFIGHGPLCHYWLTFMETYLDFGGAWWATGVKVTADMTVWSIFLNAAYSFIIGTLAMRPPKEVWRDIQVTSWPALRSAWRFWPFVHTVSFSHAVPIDLKLLWVDVMEVVWVTILSKVANEDKNAKVEEHPELEVEVMDIVEAFDVDPSLEVELTREAELKKALQMADVNLAFELPKKVLGACWPLIVMWPVLYAGYQVEKMLGLEI